MRVWYTSDLHFWHNNVIKYCNRPYSSVEEMNEMLVLAWNSAVAPDDVVYCLGDFSMAFRAVETFTRRLNGKKILVLGNHDFAHPAHKKSRSEENRVKWVQKYLDNGWDEVHQEILRDIPGFSTARLCHLPYRDSCPEDTFEDGKQRYVRHRPVDDGRLLLCGHVHEKWKHRFTSQGTLMVNVGVDAWDMKPVSEEDLCAYVSQVLSSHS